MNRHSSVAPGNGPDDIRDPGELMGFWIHSVFWIAMLSLLTLKLQGNVQLRLPWDLLTGGLLAMLGAFLTFPAILVAFHRTRLASCRRFFWVSVVFLMLVIDPILQTGIGFPSEHTSVGERVFQSLAFALAALLPWGFFTNQHQPWFQLQAQHGGPCKPSTPTNTAPPSTDPRSKVEQAMDVVSGRSLELD